MALALLLGLGACQGGAASPPLAREAIAPATAPLIADQTHTPGVPGTGFTWIPPIVTAAAAFTTLDQTGPSNNLTVRIDRLYADASTDPSAKATFAGSGISMVTGSSSAAFPGVTGPFYGVNWAPGSTVAAGQTYRVSVQALTPLRVLGVVDVQVVANSGAAGMVDRSRFTPLVVGSTLAIVFRLENKDSDGDTVTNWKDNCPFTKNFTQLDSDADGRGDACQCLSVPVNTPCKTSSCKTGETCNSAGVCTGGTATNSGGTCKTGNPCAVATERCNSSGVCGGTSQLRTSGSCTSGNPCKMPNTESCNGMGVCGAGTNASGTCVSGRPCAPATETCNAGVCAGTLRTSGSCSNGNPCRSGETCNGSGVCGGGAALAAGTSCSDGNLCTPADTCQAGICTPGTATACSTDTQCHSAGSCTRSTGLCPAIRADATTCSDGSRCTTGETCQAGVCTGGAAVSCTAADTCHTVGACVPATGCPAPVARANNTACSDGNLCTTGKTCQAGVCSGGSAVSCVGADTCHTVGACVPATGCPAPAAKGNNTACNDGNLCTSGETCQSGSCTGGITVTCAALDQCHVAGTCAPATGVCSNPTAPNGTSCNDGSLCTQTDTCQAGVCAGGNPKTCLAQDQCHLAGTCLPATGVCSNPTAPNGASCNDGNLCTQTDTCQAGACIGGNPKTCLPQDQCHVAGVCAPAVGVCSNPTVPDGTTCADGNPCTSGDACTAGVCGGTSPTCSGDVALNPALGLLLFDVWSPNGTDVYATGYNGAILHRRGDGSLSIQEVGGSIVGKIWGSSATDIYATTQGSVLHSNGDDVWTVQTVPTPGRLQTVWGSSSTDIYAADYYNGTIFHSTGNGVWTEDPTPVPGMVIAAIRGSGPTDIYAVGYDQDPVTWAQGFIIHRGGDGVWRKQLSGYGLAGGYPLSDIWVNNVHDVYVVGNSGTILHSTGDGVWTRQESNFQANINRISAPAAGTPLFVTGGAGTILRSSGQGDWTSVGSDPSSGYNGLWADSATSLWVAGWDASYKSFFRHVSLDGNGCGGWEDGNPCTADACDPVRGPTHTSVTDGTICSGTNRCTMGETCQAGACGGGVPLEPDDGNPCTADACDPATGAAHVAVADGTSCSDGNLCNGAEICMSGSCRPGLAITCAPSDQCHSAGSCDPPTGRCSNPPAPDGTACTDRDSCTQTDACQAGVCLGANPIVCAIPGDQCHTAAVCDPGTGLCANPAVPDGFACNDGDPCTRTDACQSGTCTGADPVICATSDQCHAAGSCDPGTGECTNPPQADGTPCNDGSACTPSDSCQGGICTGTGSSCPVVGGSSMVQIVDLGTLFGGSDFATGVNAVGDVVGYEQEASTGRTWAWRFTDAERLQPTTLATTSGSRGFAINGLSTIVGEVNLAANPMGISIESGLLLDVAQGFIQLQHGGVTTLTPFNGSAVGINDAGQIAAMRPWSDGGPGAVESLIMVDGVAHSLGRLSGARFTGNMLAHGIGSWPLADVVGGAETVDSMSVSVDVPGLPPQTQSIRVYEAYRFSAAMGLQNLNDDPAVTGGGPSRLNHAYATNGRQVVGSGTFPGPGIPSLCHAFRLTPGSSLVDLGTLPNYGPGTCSLAGYHPYIARAVNGRGEVVGSVSVSVATPGGAFFYSDGSGLIDINAIVDPALGYSIRTATGINDNGQIVGTLTVPGDSRTHAYRLTLPPSFTSGPIAMFDWKMQPHFPGTDLLVAKAPPRTTCTNTFPGGTPIACLDARGNPGCAELVSNPTNPNEVRSTACITQTCPSGVVASCRTSCDSLGTETCAGGAWGPCTAYEVCDGQDNDCDGLIDNGNVCATPRSAFTPAHDYGFDAILDASASQSPKSKIVSCSWDILPPAGDHIPAMGCIARVTFPSEGTFPVTLTIVTQDGHQASITRQVTIKNYLILSVGDSIASGEGNPDVDAKLILGIGSPAVWRNRRCHRSLKSWHALASRGVEDADPRSSVTFPALACSGAEVTKGLLGSYGGEEPDGIMEQPQIDVAAGLVGGHALDAMLLQIGANDAQFSAVLKNCAIPTLERPSDSTIEFLGFLVNPVFFALFLIPDGDLTTCANDSERDIIQDALHGPEGLTKRYDDLNNAIHNNLNVSPNRIYIGDYPDPLHGSDGNFCDEIRLENAVSDEAVRALPSPGDAWVRRDVVALLDGVTLAALELLAPGGGDGVVSNAEIRWAYTNLIVPLNASVSEAASLYHWTPISGMNVAAGEFPIHGYCASVPFVRHYNESVKLQGNNKGTMHPNEEAHRTSYGSRLLASLVHDLLGR